VCRRATLLLTAGLLVAAVGCHHDTGHLESELRAREQEVRELREEMAKLEAYNLALQRDRSVQPDLTAAKPLPPEAAAQLTFVRNITLARQTGGYDGDGQPGDEALQVVVEPRDADNHTVKAPGTVIVTALEVTSEGIKKPLCTWQVSAEELRRSWKSGLLSTGYFLMLPWKTWPTVEKLRVVVQFTLADGRPFEADRDVTVKLAPASLRRSVPSEPETAPEPRKVEPPGPPMPSSTVLPASNRTGLSNAIQVLKPIPLR
jgi:hypothetical protein